MHGNTGFLLMKYFPSIILACNLFSYVHLKSLIVYFTFPTAQKFYENLFDTS